MPPYAVSLIWSMCSTSDLPKMTSFWVLTLQFSSQDPVIHENTTNNIWQLANSQESSMMQVWIAKIVRRHRREEILKSPEEDVAVPSKHQTPRGNRSQRIVYLLSQLINTLGQRSLRSFLNKNVLEISNRDDPTFRSKVLTRPLKKPWCSHDGCIIQQVFTFGFFVS